jgi:hypothetical protein
MFLYAEYLEWNRKIEEGFENAKRLSEIISKCWE